MNLLTILYYTSNRQDETFERNIQKKLLESAGDTPIISISHKPIDFGTNICVGEQHPCDANLYRQITIGAKAANTPFVINAEADCLYPPEYFSFIPPTLDSIYRYTNMYVYSDVHKRFYRKKWSEGGQISGRKHLINLLEHRLDSMSMPYWSDENDKKFKNPYPKGEKIWLGFSSERPIISIKAEGGMRERTTLDKTIAPVYKVPYWGEESDMDRLWGRS